MVFVPLIFWGVGNAFVCQFALRTLSELKIRNGTALMMGTGTHESANRLCATSVLDTDRGVIFQMLQFPLCEGRKAESEKFERRSNPEAREKHYSDSLVTFSGDLAALPKRKISEPHYELPSWANRGEVRK